MASASEAAGARALKNTLYRVSSEGLGRVASLVLFAVAGRELGESGLGAFVFATAFLALITAPMDFGLDRLMLRRIAEQKRAGDELFWNVFGFKLAMAVPLFGVGLLLLVPLGYSHDAQATAWVLVPGVLADSLGRTQLYYFQAHERVGPPALADFVKRVVGASLGIAALTTGLGVVALGLTYSVGSLVGLVLGFPMMVRTVGLPPIHLTPRGWKRLMRDSLPFGTQDIFLMLLYRLDAIMLSLLASQAAVGRYGAAYRLFESSMLITYALVGAFSAMYTYLGPGSDPPLRAVFQRSIKLSLILLAPVAVAFVALGPQICSLVYGPSFDNAGVTLAILGPGVVMLSVVTLATSLLVARENPMRVARMTAAMVGINIVLNILLIPPFEDAGAAAAMLATEAVFVVIIMRVAASAAGGFGWLSSAAGALAGAAVMLAVLLLLDEHLWLGLSAGTTAYFLGFVLVERVVSPEDLRYAGRLLARLRRSGPTP